MIQMTLFILLVASGTLHLGYILAALLFYSKNGKDGYSNDLPLIQHIVCFHNESAFVKRKLESVYRINYPRIFHTFVNDNSIDDTLALLNQYKKEHTYIINNEENIGKNQSQIKSVKRFDSDLILFTDANVFLEPDSVKEMVRYFDDKTGGVTGNVTIKTDLDEIEFSGRYWNIEKRIKRFQTIAGSVIGFDGGFYCVKRENYKVKRENELSDFETAFLIFEQQSETKYAKDAKAVEIEKRTLRSSFKARMRASNRVFWSYYRISKYIRRLKPKVVFHFLFHKLFRYMFLILLVVNMPAMVIYLMTHFPWAFLFLLVPAVHRSILESIALFIGGIIALTGKEYITWSDAKS